MLAPHQRQLDLVLDLLDVEGAAGFAAAGQSHNHLLRQLFDDLMHAPRRSRPSPFDGKERLGDGNSNFAGIERGHRAVAPDDLKAWRRGNDRLCSDGLRATIADLACSPVLRE